MDSGFLVPTVILIVVLLGAPVLLVLDARERKLARQVALVAPGGASGSALGPTRGIRRTRTRYQRMREMVRSMLQYDPELRVAYERLPVPAVLVLGVIAGLGAGLFASIALSPPICVASGIAVGFMAMRGLFGWQRDRYTNSLLKQLPDTLSFVVSAVRTGIPVVEAFRGVTREMPEPTKAQFVDVMNEVALGRPVHAALLNLYYRTRVTEYAIFAVTLAVQTRSGGQLADTIQTLAETVKERLTIAGRASALAGEGKVSAMILSALPVVAGGVIFLTNPGYLDPLFHEPRGRRLFLIGVTLLLTGILTMRRMIKRVVSE